MVKTTYYWQILPILPEVHCMDKRSFCFSTRLSISRAFFQTILKVYFLSFAPQSKQQGTRRLKTVYKDSRHTTAILVLANLPAAGDCQQQTCLLHQQQRRIWTTCQHRDEWVWFCSERGFHISSPERKILWFQLWWLFWSYSRLPRCSVVDRFRFQSAASKKEELPKMSGDSYSYNLHQNCWNNWTIIYMTTITPSPVEMLRKTVKIGSSPGRWKQHWAGGRRCVFWHVLVRIVDWACTLLGGFMITWENMGMNRLHCVVLHFLVLAAATSCWWLVQDHSGSWKEEGTHGLGLGFGLGSTPRESYNSWETAYLLLPFYRPTFPQSCTSHSPETPEIVHIGRGYTWSKWVSKIQNSIMSILDNWQFDKFVMIIDHTNHTNALLWEIRICLNQKCMQV